MPAVCLQYREAQQGSDHSGVHTGMLTATEGIYTLIVYIQICHTVLFFGVIHIIVTAFLKFKK